MWKKLSCQTLDPTLAQGMENSGNPAFPPPSPAVNFHEKNIGIQNIGLTVSIALLSLMAACSKEDPESTPIDSEPVPEHSQPDIPE